MKSHITVSTATHNQTVILALAFVALFLVAFAVNAQSPVIIRNGGFTNSQYWTVNEKDTNTLVNINYTAPGESGLAGDKAARVTGRDNAAEGLRQDVLTQITNAPGYLGRTFVMRFSVKLDAPAHVRCNLQLTAGPGDTSPPFILAEQVVRSSNQWVRIEGVCTLTRTNPLAKGYIFFEVQQYGRSASLAAVPLPDYTIDNVTLDLDDDGDGLSNAEEGLLNPPTNPANPDSDGDHLPDGWEYANGTLPMTPDGDADGDNDGFTNLEEYFGATNPQDTAQKPGVPCDPQADIYAQSLLRYLALLPSRRFNSPTNQPARHVAVGQMISDALPSAADELNAYSNNVIKLADQVSAATGTERWPAILGLPAEHNSQPMQIQETGAIAETWLKAGGIVQVKFRPWNPWTQTIGGTAGINIPALISNTNDAAYILFHDWLTQIADEFARLKTACPDAVIMFRPFSEMNGAWFWWGQLSKEDYISLWRHVHQYMTLTRGLHHLIWVYESASSDHAPAGASASSVASDYYYPGDDLVDVMGHNLYSDSWDLNFDEDAIYRRYPKVTGVPQAGSVSGGIHRATGSFDNLTYLQKIEQRYPRMSFFIVWNSFGNTQTNQLVSIADNQNAVALMTNDAVVTREALNWKPSPYQVWDNANQPNADPNGDGVTNFLAYALGAPNSLSSLEGWMPALALAPSVANYVLPFGLRADAHYVVTYSANLPTWDIVAEKTAGGSWVALIPGFTVNEANGQVTVSMATAPDIGFFGLQVSGP